MSQAVEVALDDEGRIMIPNSIRDALGLAPGMTLILEEDEAGIRLRLPGSMSDPRLIDKGGVLVLRTGPLDDANDWVRHEREARAQELIERSLL